VRDFVCPVCGGSIIGDGYTMVMHCENVDVSGDCYEPDAGPIYCKGDSDGL